MDRAHCPDTQYYKLKNIHKLIDCLHLFNFLEKIFKFFHPNLNTEHFLKIWSISNLQTGISLHLDGTTCIYSGFLFIQTPLPATKLF